MLAAAKATVREVEPAQAEEEIAAGPTVVLDVREPDEYEQGALPGAVHIPRGTLETTVEGRIPDKSSHVVVYCAGGTRSAFAAQTMQELGYTDVASVIGGFNRWKDEGREWAAPAALSPQQRKPHKPPLLRGWGRVGWDRRPPSIWPRPGWGRSGSSTWTWSTPPTCSVRSSTTPTGSVNG